MVDWSAVTRGPAPAQYLRLCDAAVDAADALRARYAAVGDRRGVELADRAADLLRAERAGAAEHGVPSRHHGFGFAAGRVVSEHDWGPGGEALLDAVEAMGDYWYRHL
jgi:hypothetical protein